MFQRGIKSLQVLDFFFLGGGTPLGEFPLLIYVRAGSQVENGKEERGERELEKIGRVDGEEEVEGK